MEIALKPYFAPKGVYVPYFGEMGSVAAQGGKKRCVLQGACESMWRKVAEFLRASHVNAVGVLVVEYRAHGRQVREHVFVPPLAVERQHAVAVAHVEVADGILYHIPVLRTTFIYVAREIPHLHKA